MMQIEKRDRRFSKKRGLIIGHDDTANRRGTSTGLYNVASICYSYITNVDLAKQT